MRKSPAEDFAAWAAPSRRYGALRAPFSRLIAAALVLSTLLAPAIADAASGWWNSDWQFRKAITIRLPAAASGGAPVSRAPA